MITHIIEWSVRQRLLVLLLAFVVTVAGIWAVRSTPVDAIPDLSDVQVIVRASYPGQSPQTVQEQVTYPLTTALMAVPGATTVRGYSFYGDSYVYVLFDDDTDIYWARSRVLEYLSQVSGQLPEDVRPTLGPDATGVGWVYIYALTDRTGQHSLADLRSLQDNFLRYELQSVSGVSEIAALGGMVRQFQVIPDPARLAALKIPVSELVMALQRNNRETGASVVEMAEAEYMVRVSGLVRSVDDLRAIPVRLSVDHSPLLIGDLADVREVPSMRRGIADLDGQGEVVSGIVVMRFGDNAQAVIQRVKERLARLQESLPDGVEVVTVYDRSDLIGRAVSHLNDKLTEEFLLVVLVCALFLFHLRSSLVVILSLPVAVLAAFVVMRWQGINANIMSLGGIAIAIGAMVDGAIVMIENLHRHLAGRAQPDDTTRWALVVKSASEVGPGLFFSLMIITLSFVPVFALEAQEGRLFAPLAYTKTYAMGAAAILAVTLVPVLLGYFVRGRIRSEEQNPVSRVLTAAYQPVLAAVLRYPRAVLLLAVVLAATAIWPSSKIGSEFMPALDEGDLMYMPTTYPGISIGEARELLQKTDQIIRSVPEVATVMGKVGRADSATDPAPLTMLESFIRLKPRDQWRPGMTTAALKAELEQKIAFPGVSNAWVMPIRTRIDMLATGVKTPVGIGISGADLGVIQQIGVGLERVLGDVPGTASVYAEKPSSGRYLNITIDRLRAATYGLSVDDVQGLVAAAVGGKAVTRMIRGIERYDVSVRFPQAFRDSPDALAGLYFALPSGELITLGAVADISVDAGPAMIRSENARISGWVFIDVSDADLGGYVARAQARVAEAMASGQLSLPPGYSLNWTGQYEYLLRARDTLNLVIPATVAVILLLLYAAFRSLPEVFMILLTLPLALTGSFWLLWLLQFNLSVAVAVGFIALAGVAVEIGVIMLIYLNQAWQDALSEGPVSEARLRQVIMDGAGKRLRPVAMTVLTIAIGLTPVVFGDGTGSEVMSRIAAPMVGGTASALVLTLLVLPALYYLWRRRQL